MAGVLRGDIRWADLNPTLGHEQSGYRPVLVVSSEVLNRRSGTVIAMAITSQRPKAGFPLTFCLENTKLPRESWVKINQIRTLSLERIGQKIDHVSSDIVSQVLEGLKEILGE